MCIFVFLFCVKMCHSYTSAACMTGTWKPGASAERNHRLLWQSAQKKRNTAQSNNSGPPLAFGRVYRARAAAQRLARQPLVSAPPASPRWSQAGVPFLEPLPKLTTCKRHCAGVCACVERPGKRAGERERKREWGTNGVCTWRGERPVVRPRSWCAHTFRIAYWSSESVSSASLRKRNATSISAAPPPGKKSGRLHKFSTHARPSSHARSKSLITASVCGRAHTKNKQPTKKERENGVIKTRLVAPTRTGKVKVSRARRAGVCLPRSGG